MEWNFGSTLPSLWGFVLNGQPAELSSRQWQKETEERAVDDDSISSSWALGECGFLMPGNCLH